MSFTKSLRITIRVVNCAAVLCLLTLPVFPQTSRREETVIKLKNLIASLKTAKTDKTPITRLTELIRQHGVDFQLTPEIENKIRSAGSYLSKESLDDLVGTVRSSYRSLQPSAAPGNTSIEDIVIFVKGKLSDSTFGYRLLSKESSQPHPSIFFSYDNVEVSQCKLSWQEKRTFRWNERNTSPDTSLTTTFEINLSDIDPEQIRLERLYEPETWSIIMTTTNSEKKIKVTEFDTIEFRNKSDVTFADKKLAQRVSVALKDFVKRCGGKSEPY